MKMHKSKLLSGAAALPVVLGLAAGAVVLSPVVSDVPAYASCNPCQAAKKAACGACNPCAAAKKAACNPCNPCAAAKAACNPCNPCSAAKE
ncbi:MAG: hypothetical protein ABJM26_01520 [Anderseniella sp.]